MSDRPCKIRRTMRRRLPICGDDWLHIFELMHHRQLGLEIATLSEIFDIRVDKHFKKRKWTLGKLVIKRGTDQNKAMIVKNYFTENVEHLPLPDGPLPKNIVGFECIDIRYVDHKVIDFLRQIRRLFQTTNNGDNDGIGLALGINSIHVRSWAVFRDFIWPQIDQSAVTKLNFFGTDSFDSFRQHISPTLLLDLANARVIDVQFDVRFGDGENGQLLRQWLHIPRADGKPKLLKSLYNVFQTVEQLKTSFLSAETAVSFIITFFSNAYHQPVPFELENLRTGERLTFREVDDQKYIVNWLLERGPIGGRNVEQWAKWGREAMDMALEKHNLLTLSFGDEAIGPFDDESAGPSGSGQQQSQQK